MQIGNLNKMSNFSYSLTCVAFFAIIQCGLCDVKCNPPKVKAGEKITVEIMFVSNYAMNLTLNLCEIFDEFKDFINVIFRMGSQSVENGNELWCGEGVDCIHDRTLACHYEVLGFHGYNDGYPCASLPDHNKKEVENCMKEHSADHILIANGQKRQNYGIPDFVFATLALNESYDPCINLYVSSGAGLKKYFCEVLGNVLPCQ